MQSGNLAVLFALLLVIGANAEPRRVLSCSNAEQETAVEHQRILAELEEVHQLRERMLQEGEPSIAMETCLGLPRVSSMLRHIVIHMFQATYHTQPCSEKFHTDVYFVLDSRVHKLAFA